MIKTLISFKPTLAIIVFALMASVNAEVYRVVDADGKITFTDNPPENTDDLIEKVPDTDPQQNITATPESLIENQPEWLNEAQEKRAQATKNTNRDKQIQNQQDKQDWQRSLKAARADVKAAKLMLEIGSEPTEGDFVGNAGGGARPSSDYLKRLTSLEKNLADAKRHLLKVQRSKPK
tara:strand:+ start:346 stop:879 length:534 start_codon:yes stop_codon:yes gene_type:complete